MKGPNGTPASWWGGGRNVSWMHATEEPALNAPGESLAVPETRTFEYIEES